MQKQTFYNILIILKLLVDISIGLTINLFVLGDAKKNFKCIKSLNFQGWHNSINALKEKMNNTDAVNVFLALGQETRFNTFRLIVQRGDVGLTPSEISEKLGIPNGTLSFHLKELLHAKLIFVDRQGRNLIYRPAADQIDKLSNFLLDNCCGGKPCITPVRKKKVAC